MSADADLFLHDRQSHRDLVSALPDIGAANGTPVSLIRDGGTFVRGRLDLASHSIEVDVVFDAVQDVEPPPPAVQGIVLESLADLRANKLTCLLSRSEPRDLVDLLFLDRAGYPPERDLSLALRKDAAIDPGVIAWLLSQFPVEPLPMMLVSLTTSDLRGFRDELAARFRRIALPPGTL